MTISHTENQTTSNNIITLASWMAGGFSNQKQASTNPVLYAHIHVYFRPLPYQFFSGIGFYSEQVYDYDLWSPYRQGVHKLIDKGDHIYIENYRLKDPILYAGAARELDILHTITPENIERRYHCSMVFKRDGEKFLGSVEPGNKCLINKRGCETYLVSEVELTEQTWESLDIGKDIKKHKQVWGSKAGKLKFEKKISFADELPIKN
ncbi:MAG: chorismate-binding protein [Okeania sp. SIO3H1]|uniref:chromophore lyase CpcT/CpeT n=1 Tax=Okeania sp. SIO1I7 TaxID=2607772 RepID=UPI0013C9992C|nr:chromophore lyase CpcT/CpeT [Okeania sp. SIO1I7]NEN91734.1 chorismate-binding protein [Okeania sp. SIO3H1]NET28754.1 chorismate-binding protein [Okeania sp. SIO1I7]